MNYQEIFRWLAIAVGIGGMITWMITYQLCVIYFRRHKKDIAHILYSEKNITIKNWTVMTYIFLLLQWQAFT